MLFISQYGMGNRIFKFEIGILVLKVEYWALEIKISGYKNPYYRALITRFKLKIQNGLFMCLLSQGKEEA